MSFEYMQKIPSASEIISEIPVPLDLKNVKSSRDKEIGSVFTGKSKKFLIVIGPCSADNEDAVCDYAVRLRKIQEKVKDRILIVPRIYTNKPRTTGEGYKGMAHQPDPNEEPNIVAGIKAIRRMHIRALKESHLSSADEMLYPGNYPYLEDILSYVAIGARSVENQLHRLTVSGLDIPVGMKNPTGGDLTVMLNSVQAAQMSHIFIYNGWQVKTTGNPLSHCIVRGAVNNHGQNIPNYHYEDLVRLADMYLKRNLENPVVLVDTNHANSGKLFKEQPRIAMEVIQSMKHSELLGKMIRGLVVESYIVEGSQSVKGKVYGQSITDPCLGWKDSERLILDVADNLKN